MLVGTYSLVGIGLKICVMKNMTLESIKLGSDLFILFSLNLLKMYTDISKCIFSLNPPSPGEIGLKLFNCRKRLADADSVQYLAVFFASVKSGDESEMDEGGRARQP